MSNLDTYCHILGIEFLTILGMVWLLTDEQPVQQTVSTLFLLLLGVMITHAITHLLPHAIENSYTARTNPFIQITFEPDMEQQ
jgi:hypothetical protein